MTEAMTDSPNNPIAAARQLLLSLEKQFPVFQSGAPLAIGIDKQLFARMPDIDKKTLRTALRLHTGSTRYLKAMEKAEHRLDLDGNAAGEITQEHRTLASTTLKDRFKKSAQQRKEKLQAEKEAVQAEKEAAERQAKLQELAAKFSTRH
jgi:ProP effector